MRTLVGTFLACLCAAAFAGPCDMPGPSGEQLNGPAVGQNYSAWLTEMRAFRDACLSSIAYNGSIYDTPELKWTQTGSWMQPQMHPYDNYFYDPAVPSGYTVSKWLSDLDKRYGGIDAALVWPTYTNIGTDDRSQFQLITSMPGGIDGITAFSKQLHAAGVRVLWPYNPWDTGTHRDEQGRSDAQLLAWLANWLGR